MRQLVGDVDRAAAGAGYPGGGDVASRGTAIAWTFPSTSPGDARQFVVAARAGADTRNIGSWIVTADDHE